MEDSIAYVIREPKYYKYIDYFCFFIVGIIVGLVIIYWQLGKQSLTNQQSNTRVQVQTPSKVRATPVLYIKEI